MLKNLRGSAPSTVQASASQDQSNGGKRGNQLTFGKEDEDNQSNLGSSHVMLDDSSNSMVNMAISMDPLDANKALGAID